MAWPEKRRARDGSIHYRIRDRIQGEIVTVVKNAGQWKDIAIARLLEYEKQKAAGQTDLLPDAPLPIEEMCDLYLAIHGKALKGGVSKDSRSTYYSFRLRVEHIKACWRGKFAHEITPLDIQEFLAPSKTIGTRMRWLGVLGNMFRLVGEWNEEGNILPRAYRLPAVNPAHKWRKQMKSSEKREQPDRRVLTFDEWKRFSKHLSVRARHICEVALGRFLRKSDIKAISHLSMEDGHIKGLQAKTGEPFSVPVISNQPTRYDFTNFHRDFQNAQIKAGLFYPPDHPLHFSLKDLRRTGATWYYRKTKDLVGVSRMLGHRDLKTTQLYLHMDASDLGKVADVMDSFIFSRGAPVEHFRIKQIRGTH